MKNKLVVIRTLDIGGDKKLPYFHFDNEENPFLGFRAIRFLLKNKKIFRTQLRALGRASVYGKLAIMFPMIANISEFVESKQYTETIFNELRKENIPVAKNIQIGMMVEIPSSAIIADKFSKYSDFFSIGTNDLIQYTFAADRLNKSCNYLYQPNNPAILKLIKSTIDGAKLNNKWVGMCGEMASDITSTPLLIGLGINSLSVHPTKIKKIRQIVNNIKSSDCKELASKALSLENCEKINNLVNSFLKERKLI
jgi:phosphotransferase system enzyme I (PtsI)